MSTRYAVVYTLHSGRERRHSVDAWITGVPDGVKAHEVSEALGTSALAVTYSDRGVFMANRRMLTEAQVPAGADSASASEILWTDLTKGASDRVQVNVRCTSAERARLQNEAKAAGQTFQNYVHAKLFEQH